MLKFIRSYKLTRNRIANNSINTVDRLKKFSRRLKELDTNVSLNISTKTSLMINKHKRLASRKDFSPRIPGANKKSPNTTTKIISSIAIQEMAISFILLPSKLLLGSGKSLK